GPARADRDTVDSSRAGLREAVNSDRGIGRNIGMRYHDGKPSMVEGLLSRGDRRVGRVLAGVWPRGGRFDGRSEYFSYQRWMDASEAELTPLGVNMAWFTSRERDETEIL